MVSINRFVQTSVISKTSQTTKSAKTQETPEGPTLITTPKKINEANSKKRNFKEEEQGRRMHTLLRSLFQNRQENRSRQNRDFYRLVYQFSRQKQSQDFLNSLNRGQGMKLDSKYNVADLIKEIKDQDGLLANETVLKWLEVEDADVSETELAKFLNNDEFQAYNILEMLLSTSDFDPESIEKSLKKLIEKLLRDHKNKKRVLEQLKKARQLQNFEKAGNINESTIDFFSTYMLDYAKNSEEFQEYLINIAKLNQDDFNHPEKYIGYLIMEGFTSGGIGTIQFMTRMNNLFKMNMVGMTKILYKKIATFLNDNATILSLVAKNEKLFETTLALVEIMGKDQRKTRRKSRRQRS